VQPVCHLDRFVTVDRNDLINKAQIQVFGDKTGSQPLDFVRAEFERFVLSESGDGG
jgi:hypothetical protein